MYNIKTTPSKVKEVVRTNIPKTVDASLGSVTVKSYGDVLQINNQADIMGRGVAVPIDFLREIIKEYDNCE